MKTNARANAIADPQIPARPRIVKAKAGSHKAVTPMYPSVRTLDDWNAWMRARDRYQWNPED